jgi:hypothetical protein
LTKIDPVKNNFKVVLMGSAAGSEKLEELEARREEVRAEMRRRGMLTQ